MRLLKTFLLLLIFSTGFGQITFNTLKVCSQEKNQSLICTESIRYLTTFTDIQTLSGYYLVVKSKRPNKGEEIFKLDISSINFLRDEGNNIYGKVVHIYDEGEEDSQLIINEREDYAIYIFYRENKKMYGYYTNSY